MGEKVPIIGVNRTLCVGQISPFTLTEHSTPYFPLGGYGRRSLVRLRRNIAVVAEQTPNPDSALASKACSMRVIRWEDE